MAEDPEEFDQDEESDVRAKIADGPVQPTCPGCGYDLSGTLEAPQQRCPECGRAWTVDELALQHAQRLAGVRPPNRVLAAIGPGLTIAGLLLVGLIFGPPVNWLTFPVAAVLVVLATVEWARDLHRKSFERPRTRFDRFVYVTGMTLLLVASNAVLIVIIGLLLIVLVSASGMLHVGMMT